MLRQRHLCLQALHVFGRWLIQRLRQLLRILQRLLQQGLQRRQLLGKAIGIELEQSRVAHAAPGVFGDGRELGRGLVQGLHGLLARMKVAGRPVLRALQQIGQMGDLHRIQFGQMAEDLIRRQCAGRQRHAWFRCGY